MSRKSPKSSSTSSRFLFADSAFLAPFVMELLVSITLRDPPVGAEEGFCLWLNSEDLLGSVFEVWLMGEGSFLGGD